MVRYSYYITALQNEAHGNCYRLKRDVVNISPFLLSKFASKANIFIHTLRKLQYISTTQEVLSTVKVLYNTSSLHRINTVTVNIFKSQFNNSVLFFCEFNVDFINSGINFEDNTNILNIFRNGTCLITMRSSNDGVIHVIYNYEKQHDRRQSSEAKHVCYSTAKQHSE
jgi:hypothetical protein